MHLVILITLIRVTRVIMFIKVIKVIQKSFYAMSPEQPKYFYYPF